MRAAPRAHAALQGFSHDLIAVWPVAPKVSDKSLEVVVLFSALARLARSAKTEAPVKLSLFEM